MSKRIAPSILITLVAAVPGSSKTPNAGLRQFESPHTDTTSPAPAAVLDKPHVLLIPHQRRRFRFVRQSAKK